jgi:hypothetical protein
MNAIRKQNRDESGAIAVLAALTIATMMVIGALAVDLGDMYQRKAESQSQADLAALSAAPALGCCGTVAVRHQNAVDKVRDYLKANTKLGQSGGLAGLTSAMLTDGDLTNGEVTFPGDYSMKVQTPNARVDFALAQAGQGNGSSADVSASATVGVGTPGSGGILPMFAVGSGGCDFGSQTLTDPANGHHVTSVPSLPTPLHDAAQTSNATLDSADPFRFDAGSAGVIGTIAGAHLSSVNEVAYFSDPLNSPAPPATVVPQPIVSNTNNNSISDLPVPTAVTNYPGVWWIRTYTATGNKGWSPLDQSLPIRIGDGPIQCPSSVVSGNFGTLKLPRTDTTPANWLATNVAKGLQPPLSLQSTSNPAEIPNCTPGDLGVTYSSTTGTPTLLMNTNCVDTDTGLTSNATTQGLLANSPSRLNGKPTTSSMSGRNCAPGATNNNQRTAGSYTFNNDTLSCFMTDPNMSLATIAVPNYSGGAALNPAIFDSPRFVYVPVVAVDPGPGGSQHWSIVGMRAGFITGEDNTSRYSSQAWNVHSSSADNGVTITNNKVTSLQVFFFNDAALPNQGGGAQPGVILDPNGPLVPFLID